MFFFWYLDFWYQIGNGRIIKVVMDAKVGEAKKGASVIAKGRITNCPLNLSFGFYF